MLQPHHAAVFDLPFFQLAQIKRYCPERLDGIKAAHRSAWLVWRHTVENVAAQLGAEFAPPHIERWCNGWQVRAHFFAYFKYTRYQDSAVIFSLLLNRRRLGVCLDWHSYRAAQSAVSLEQYRQWPQALAGGDFDGFDMWRDSDGEYADYPTAAVQRAGGLDLALGDFFCIGSHIERGVIGQTDSAAWLAAQIRALQPLYETCFTGS
ncbi:HI_0552 family protein [Neisseria musculi]|uniref:Glucose-6-phosphate 1-dehydrogenase family protein n=1 Tax=Neisseria musculi TaxID=1815583 RepID=A0A7H1MAK9_9NEIS|nr:HI_0552 family protein [Neisseria musculi]QNT58674.1 glucose-6-phosphate 1-dehydrogenase family protein [Neisseria musculi]